MLDAIFALMKNTLLKATGSNISETMQGRDMVATDC